MMLPVDSNESCPLTKVRSVRPADELAVQVGLDLGTLARRQVAGVLVQGVAGAADELDQHGRRLDAQRPGGEHHTLEFFPGIVMLLESRLIHVQVFEPRLLQFARAVKQEAQEVSHKLGYSEKKLAAAVGA